MRTVVLVSIAVFLTLSLFGCQTLLASSTKPTVVVNAPPSGSTYQVGDDVTINSTATDAHGVTRVELQVDGNTVRTDVSPVAQGQTQFSLLQTWKASGVGQHSLLVRAYNSSGAYTDSGLTVIVTENTAGGPNGTTVISTIPPGTSTDNSATPVPTTTPAPLAGGCTPNLQYVADVTIPDGTVVAPGATFTKTWRVLNNGTCPWDNSYAIAFVSGTQLASGAAQVPPAAPGAMVDISLVMTAPTAFGTFTGNWQLRAPNGALVGANLTTVINISNSSTPVPANTNTPVPTNTNTPQPGLPHIASFTCSPCTIVAGSSATLDYGLVSNANSATIDQGVGNIATPGHKTVSPTKTTTYTLTATGAGGTTQKSVTVTVVGNFAGHWEHDFGYMDLTQSGESVTGTFHNSSEVGDGTIAGTVSGNTLNGNWQRNVSGSLQFTLGGSGNTFTGNWNGSDQWCGARTGISFPSGCAFAGHWNSKYDPGTGTQCALDLSQVGSTVTGTYCNGTIGGGTIKYAGGYVVLSGTWHFGNVNSGPFIFYLPVYTSQQFQGDYNSSLDWCGWRTGSSMPSPCEK